MLPPVRTKPEAREDNKAPISSATIAHHSDLSIAIDNSAYVGIFKASLHASVGPLLTYSQTSDVYHIKLIHVTSPDAELGNYSTVTINNKIFLPPPLGTSQRSLCNIGPSVWCQSEQNQRICGVYNQTIGTQLWSVQSDKTGLEA